MFRQMMDLTLKEDKEIVESIYPEYQRGFMNARYDQQVCVCLCLCMREIKGEREQFSSSPAGSVCTHGWHDVCVRGEGGGERGACTAAVVRSHVVGVKVMTTEFHLSLSWRRIYFFLLGDFQ